MPAERAGRFDRRMEVALRSVVLVGGGLSLGALVFAGRRPALSVAVGAGLAAVNLWALARIVVALLPADAAVARTQSPFGWAVLAVLKITGMFAALGLAMSLAPVSPLALVVGSMALPIGIAIGSLVSDRNPDPKDAP